MLVSQSYLELQARRKQLALKGRVISFGLFMLLDFDFFSESLRR